MSLELIMSLKHQGTLGLNELYQQVVEQRLPVGKENFLIKPLSKGIMILATPGI